MNKRIDNLTTGSPVLLRLFTGSHIESEEPATFLRVEGEGEARVAWFQTHLNDGSHYAWPAYRFQGRWAYGSSADRLQLWKVLGVEESATMPDKPAERTPTRRTPFDIADKLSVEWVGQENYSSDYQEVRLTVRDLRGLLIEAATQARAS